MRWEGSGEDGGGEQGGSLAWNSSMTSIDS